MSEYVKELPQNSPLVFVVGAVAKGNPGMENDYVQESICVSKYSLSAAYAIAKILFGFESLWKIL
jgi:rRNA small subunit pseudouridine methyltransferase Nep1